MLNFVNSHGSKLACTLYIAVWMAAKNIKHKVLTVYEELEALRRNNNTVNKKNIFEQRVTTQPGRKRAKNF